MTRRDTDGVPAAFIAKSIHAPGSITPGFDGISSSNTPGSTVRKATGMRRWSWLTVCVVTDWRTSANERIDVSPVTRMRRP